MITIIPTLEILRAVTDSNWTGSANEIRRKAFDFATNLKTLADVDVVIEGRMFNRVKHRLIDEHLAVFESTYRIDNSIRDVDVAICDMINAVKWIAKQEAKVRKVIILTENITQYDCGNPFVLVMKPSSFLEQQEGILKISQTLSLIHKGDKDLKYYNLTKVLHSTFFDINNCQK